MARRDLLVLLDRVAPEDLPEALTAALGFERIPPPPDPDSTSSPSQDWSDGPDPDLDSDDEPVTAPHAPGERALRFLLPVHLVAEAQPAPPRYTELGVSALGDDQLVAPHDAAPMPVAPLVPWSRLRGFARLALGTDQPSQEIDLPKLIRRLSAGQVLAEIPRQLRHSWCPHAVLLLDHSQEMRPFIADLRQVARHLEGEMSRTGLEVLWLRDPADCPSLPEGVPVFALSAMGQLSRDAARQEAWLRLGAQLRFRGHALAALVPCPRQRWHPDLARHWTCAVWDRGRRLPRRRGLRAIPAEAHDSGVKRLLSFISQTTLVEPGLLRQLRLLAGPAVDVGAEHDAWVHEDCWAGMSYFGMEDEAKPRYLDAWVELPADFRHRAGQLIRRDQESHSPLARLETLLRLAVHEGVEDSAPLLDDCERGFKQLLVRMRAINRGERAAGREFDWFDETEAGFPEGLRRQKRLAKTLAACAAQVAFHRRQREVRFREGIDPEAAAAELEAAWAAAGEVGRRTVTCRLHDQALCFDGGQGSHMGFLEVLGNQAALQTPTDRVSLRLGTSEVRQALSPWPATLRLRSHGNDLRCLGIPRPVWARNMGTDPYGTWAEPEVRGVSFRLRWIPPGRFLMGESGSARDVVIEHGFWMAETPCTQALWTAVTGENPSGFKGETRPVERVDWDSARAFCRALGAEVEDLDFDLPSEAQWEYACRAGTRSAFNDGSEDGLDALGWYDGNSGKETHPVAEKEPNAWGLYDMHGNVWEWCLDLPDVGRVARVVRGGSWFYVARSCRSASRSWPAPGSRNHTRGFRLLAGQGEPGEAKSSASGASEGAERPGGVLRRLLTRKSESAPPDRDVTFPEQGTIHLWSRSAVLPEQGPRVPRWASAMEGPVAVLELGGARFRFRWIEPGTFWMGSPEDETGRWPSEGPRHQVTLSHGFWLAITPTTQAQWQAVAEDNPSRFKGAERPVERVSWEDCQGYFRGLNARVPGLRAQLPTEAQWEYACRAGSTAAFNNDRPCTQPSSKDPALDELGWFDENSGGETHSVAEKEPNAWGLYDMHGNVWEWCRDGRRDYSAEAATDPVGSMREGVARVVRGGSWLHDARHCRSAYRLWRDPGLRLDSLGFRLLAGQGEPGEAQSGASGASP